MPDNTPLGPGTRYPWDPDPNQAPPVSPDDLPTPAPGAAGNIAAKPAATGVRPLSPQEQQAIISSIGGHEGWFVVGGAAVPETKMGQDTLGRPVMLPTGSYTITLADGKGHTEPNVTITESGPDPATGNPTWIPSKTPTDLPKDQTHPDIPSQNGKPGYTWDPNKVDPATNKPGMYVQTPGAPIQGQAPPKEGDTRNAVEGGRNVTQTYQGGQWTTTTVGTPATPGAAVEGGTRDIIEGGRYVTQTYQNGEWHTTKVGDPATPGAPKQGDTRPSVENGRYVTQTYDGSAWRTTSVGESAIPGGGKEGDKRQVVENGRNVTQTFQNGAWLTTGIGDSAIPGAAKEGDKRQTVEAGRYVNQVYQNGGWVTTSLGDNAVPGAAKEGDTRKNVQGGFTVQEVYKNGGWVVDPSVPPQRFTPQDPTVVSAPATQLNIATMQNGQISTQPNPNFMASSTAEVAARVAQLQGMAAQQRDALKQQQQSGAITADQANQQFDAWWAQNVEPQKSALDAAQRAAGLAERQKAEEQSRANYATAQAAGTNAVNAQQALLPYMVGPGFGAALNNIQGAYASGKAPGNIDIGSAVTFQLPDMQQLAQQATNQALAHISPTASQNMAQGTGVSATPQLGQQAQQQPQNLDMGQALNKQNYAPTVTVAPDGTVRVQQNTQPQQAQPVAPTPNSTQVPGQNYTGTTGYTGGISPWNAGPQPAIPNYRPLSAAVAPGQFQ